MNPDDICPRPTPLPQLTTSPHATPIYAASVWTCESPQQADEMLGGKSPGYVYQRDGHPNADVLADKCRELHGAQKATITATGMAALSVPLLALLQPGDHVIVGSRLYGKTQVLFAGEGGRLGIHVSIVDTCDLAATAAAMTPQTKLLVAETIANPLLQVADISALAEIAHRGGAKLLVDNTFASPIVCRPLAWGADLVMESLTKTMNGHSDVVLGLICGNTELWQRIPTVMSAWGFSSSPFDCWLAARGLCTAHLRIQRGCENALQAASFLTSCTQVAQVYYPGLANHPQHALAVRQLTPGLFGTMVSFSLRGGRPAADAFIAAAKNIPFCPSLGELSTTLSHPETTSHRGMTPQQRAALGIDGGTIRLSVGTESSQFIIEALTTGLAAVK